MSKKILLCDDAPTALKLMEMVLGDEGYEIFKAENAEQAMKSLEVNGPFDGCVFDVNMPGKNGIELSRDFLAHPKGTGANIVIVSTESSDHLRQAGKDAGVKAWIVKPFDDEDLIEVLKRITN
ncbi:response regulator [Leptospira congkakensis]|uniref:Response regulator n=1 Tax=Leptospira congkakensis TaxID=2484932 RepID=A0A4Z1AEQ3_9LEPT|nr:response regulator [Leptospira congkakensis]TGL87147.1 response regulator [Leptospira congkakensis]TGL96715.1 response regulator [Leptospira congkakensis]TGL97564.1 response regulator [Leptospira congkakensis]